MKEIVTKLELCSENFRKFNPNHCPVKLITGDNHFVGACWHYLRYGKCPDHGQIYEETQRTK